MITILLNTILESAPYVVLGFIIAGLVRFYVPRFLLSKHLGQHTTASLLKSVVVGCLLPICSCGTIPLGIGLYKSGASTGNMLAFMTSAPILSPVLIALSLTLLGVKITTILLSTCIVGALLLGVIGNLLFHTSTKNTEETPKYTPYKENSTSKSKFTEMLRWSFGDLGADVSVDLVIGLGIAALLLTVLPMEWISMWLGQQKLSTLLYVIALGIPVYACSIPSIPVVQGLLLLGATPGAAVAYMIAGPATNLGELNAIRKSMGRKVAVYYASALVIIALVSGMITDHWIFSDYQYHAYKQQGELVVSQCCVPFIFGESIGSVELAKSIPAWHWPFGFVLCLVLLFGVWKRLCIFFKNPCTSCAWEEYKENKSCSTQCHVRRKYDIVNRYTPSL